MGFRGRKTGYPSGKALFKRRTVTQKKRPSENAASMEFKTKTQPSKEKIMNYQYLISQTETRYGVILPDLYKHLSADGMLDFGDFIFL